MSLGLDQNLVLAAGAGSGKTHALVTVALGLYTGAGARDGKPIEPSRVWAVTFTEKAAAELRQRILGRVRALAASPVEGLALEKELGDMLGDRVPDGATWQAVASDLGGAPIGTFHGLCAQILRQHAAEAGVDPDFSILDERESAVRFDGVLERVLMAALSGEGTTPVHELVARLGDLEILRLVVRDLRARLAEEGATPRSLLTRADGSPRPAFDRAQATQAFADACRELCLAFEPLAATEEPKLAKGAAAYIRERERIGDCDPDEMARWYPAAASVWGQLSGAGLNKASRAIWAPLRDAWKRLDAAHGAQLEAACAGDLCALLERVEAAYDAEKRRAGALDFSDLVRRVRDLLRDDRAVRDQVKRRIGALLVDEFQDTNGVQLELVHLLAESRDTSREVGPETPSRDLPMEPGILCAVGDRKQSIYEFRGADVSIFNDLCARAREGNGLRLQALDRSWRSRPGLVNFANACFAQLMAEGDDGAPYRVDWVDDEDPLTAVRTDPPALEAVPPVVLLECDPELKARRKAEHESDRVARYIKTLLDRGIAVGAGSGARPVQGADVAILLRALSNLQSYRDALRALGIPSVVVRGRGFYGTREVRDLAALLMAIADPRDRFACAAVLRSTAYGVSDAGLVKLAARKQLQLAAIDPSVAESLDDRDRAALERLVHLVRRLGRQVDRLGAGGVLERAVEALDLRVMLAAADDGEQALANVEKLLDELREVRGLGARAAAEHILSLADQPQDREPPADVTATADTRAVRIMSVHASKGLEFPVVVVPELGRPPPNDARAALFERGHGLAIRVANPLRAGRLKSPHAEQVAATLKDRAAAERARLLYVALTRARDHLVLCGEGTRSGTWRAELERAMPAVESLVYRLPLDASPSVLLEALPALRDRVAGQMSLLPGGEDPEASDKLLANLRPLPPAGGDVSLGVTDLAEVAHCLRRYSLRRLVGLPERPARRLTLARGLGPVDPSVTDDDGVNPEHFPSAAADPMRRGSLAHAVLERVDLDAAAQDAEEAAQDAARAEGLEPADDAVAEILGDVVALLEGPLGQKLIAIWKADPRRVLRELPFVMAAGEQGGTRVVLHGQMDLCFVDDDGTVVVIDYKHAHRGINPGYAFQLQTYALAAARVWPEGVKLRAGLCWLKDRDRDPLAGLEDVTGAALDEHAGRLAELSDRLCGALAQDAWPGLSAPERCGDCGYARRCWSE